MQIRRFVSTLLAVIMLLCTLPHFVTASRFEDVPQSNRALTRAVNLLYGMGITTGTSETAFGTDEYVTRQQMSAFIYRLMKKGKSVENGENSTTFTDLEDPFYNSVISWASNAGIIKGTSATTFNPRGYITLQDAYVMLTRALEYEKNKEIIYPIGYIDIAEEIGLDEDIPSDVYYTKYLKRADVAILLYNAFYADMATGTTAYETEYEEVEVKDKDGNVKLQAVETGMTPYTKYDTVAEKIFGVRNTVERVVATNNYSLDDYEKTDGKSEQYVTLKVIDDDYKEYDHIFGTLPFEKLGLSGEADDYFLIDLSIYYRENGADTEIVAVSPLGTRKRDVSREKVVFERMSGTTKSVYYGGHKEDQKRRLTGKVTVDGVVSYLFDAPFAERKYKRTLDRRDYITLLFLDKTTRPVGSEDYEQDFNFKSDRDVVGHEASWYKHMIEFAEYHVGDTDKTVLANTQEKDPVAGGLYTDWGIYQYMGLDINRSPYFEVDVWDSDGDGKIDYMWTKPFTAGKAVIREGDTFRDRHYSEGFYPIGNWCAVYENEDVSGLAPCIYFDEAYVEGEMPKNGQLVMGYINAPANYIKVSDVREWEYSTRKLDKIGPAATTVYFNGQVNHLWGYALRILGAPNALGYRQQYFNVIGREPNAYDKQHNYGKYQNSSGAYQTLYFNEANIGREFSYVNYDGVILYAEPASASLSAEREYAFLYPDKDGRTKSFPHRETEDGVLLEKGQYIEALIGDKVSYVEVYPQNNKNLKITDEKPYTARLSDGGYDFSDYAGKPLVYTRRNDGSYVFSIAPFDKNRDRTVLSGSNSQLYYTFEGDVNTKASFIRRGNGLYTFGNIGEIDETVPTDVLEYSARGAVSCYREEGEEDGIEYVRMIPRRASFTVPKLDMWGLEIDTNEYPFVKICYRTTKAPGTRIVAEFGLGAYEVGFGSKSSDTWESAVFSLPADRKLAQYRVALLGEESASKLGDETADLMYVAFFRSLGEAVAYKKDVSGTVQIEGQSFADDVNVIVSPSRYLSLADNARIIIKTVKNGEEIFTTYDKSNPPDFDEDTALNNIKYVVRNNPKSTTIEELLYMYAEAADGTVKSSVGRLDYRFVKSVTRQKSDDGVKLIYEAYNPETGEIAEYEGDSDSEDIPNGIVGAIVTETSEGLLSDSTVLGRIDTLGAIADEDTDEDTDNLGLCIVEEYDSESGLVMLSGYEKLYRICEDTKITFINLDNEEIKAVEADTLGSTSNQYRCGGNKDVPILVFVLARRIKNEEDVAEAEIITIVRADGLEEALIFG